MVSKNLSLCKSTKTKVINVSSQWIDPVLQGLAYWIGYIKELYRDQLLNEGEIVVVVASLINANITSGEIVKCEQFYDQIDGIKGNKIRADILILKRNEVHTAIEVISEESGNQLIEKDVLKLLAIKEKHPNVKCYQIIISQGKMPGSYVSDEGGNALSYPIIDIDFDTKAIQVCKSTSSFKEESPEKANYVCLIEVSM